MKVQNIYFLNFNHCNLKKKIIFKKKTYEVISKIFSSRYFIIIDLTLKSFFNIVSDVLREHILPLKTLLHHTLV